MDEQNVRQHAQAHADAVVRGDMDAVASDLVEPLRPALAQLAPLFPQPVTSADVTRLDVEAQHAVAQITYRGDDKELVIESRWEEQDGRPMIVAAEPLQ
jgi:hypothetical protein